MTGKAFEVRYVGATADAVTRLSAEVQAELGALLARLADDPHTETQPDARSPRLRTASLPTGQRVLLSVNGERPPFMDPLAFWRPTLTVVEVMEP